MPKSPTDNFISPPIVPPEFWAVCDPDMLDGMTDYFQRMDGLGFSQRDVASCALAALLRLMAAKEHPRSYLDWVQTQAERLTKHAAQLNA